MPPFLNPSMESLTLALALALALFVPLAGSSSLSLSPSPSPSPSPAPPVSLPKHFMSHPAGLSLRYPPQRPRHPSPPPPRLSHPQLASVPLPRPRHPSPPPPWLSHARLASVPPPPAAGRGLGLGRTLGIIFATVAGALQVSLAGFLVYKRYKLRSRMGLGYRRKGRGAAALSSPSSSPSA